MSDTSQKICLDANIWVKLFVPEEKTDQVKDLFRLWLDRATIFVAPSFLLFEVASTLRRKEKMKLLREGDGQTGLRLFYDYPILLYQSEEFLEEAWNLARQMNETVLYDVSYLALASWQQVPFYTADEKFFAQAKKFYPDAYLI